MTHEFIPTSTGVWVLPLPLGALYKTLTVCNGSARWRNEIDEKFEHALLPIVPEQDPKWGYEIISEGQLRSRYAQFLHGSKGLFDSDSRLKTPAHNFIELTLITE